MDGQLDFEVEVKSDVDKFWDGIMDSVNLFPKASPEVYKSIQALEGDGISVGSVRLVKGHQSFSLRKKRLKLLIPRISLLAYSVVDGDLRKYYKALKAHREVTPTGDVSLVKWLCEFEKASDGVPES